LLFLLLLFARLPWWRLSTRDGAVRTLMYLQLGVRRDREGRRAEAVIVPVMLRRRVHPTSRPSSRDECHDE
jgi:hypothetical protein